MKKIILVMLGTVLILGITQLQAQEKGNRKEFRKNKMERGDKRNGFGKDLQLTDEQKAKAKAINEEYQAKMKALKSDDNITMGEYKKREAALKKERREKLEAILTPEQKEKVKEDKENTAENIDKMMDKMKTDLNLSESQATKIKAIHIAYAAKIKAIRDNDNLTPEEKKQQILEVSKARRAEVDTVLTKEQIKKRDEILKERKDKRFRKQQ